MYTFVGAEFVIANILIARAEKGRPEISLKELNDYGIHAQRYCIDHNVDALFLVSSDQIHNAIYNFSDYFEFSKDTMSIHIKKGSEQSVKARFLGFLPFDIIKAIIQSAHDFVA